MNTNEKWSEASFRVLFRNVTSSNLKIAKKHYNNSGLYQIIDQGVAQIAGYTNDSSLVHTAPLPVLVFGDHTRCVKYVDKQFVQGADGVKVLYPARDINPMFIFWLLKQKAKQLRNKGYARHFSELRKSVFLIPSLNEQQQIVQAIESYLSRLDDAVASLERAQRNLKRYRASVLKSAVEGRLVPTEAELARRENRDYEPASLLLERILVERKRRFIEDAAEKGRAKAEAKAKAAGKPWTEADNDKVLAKEREKAAMKYKEPAAPDTTGLPELPEGWCWASPEQIKADEPYALGIGPFGSNLKVSDYSKSGVPLVFVRNIRSETFGMLSDHYITKEKAETLKPHAVMPGDILVTKMGDPPGDTCIYPFNRPRGIITADCIKLRPDPAFDDNMFLVNIIRSKIVQAQILRITKGVAQKKVSLDRFKKIALPIAPRGEQRRVNVEIEGHQSLSKHVEKDLLHNLNHSKTLRQSILKWAFEGKLVDQDPNDEPASVLLERIKAEKAAQETAKKKTKRGRKGKQS